MVKGYNECKRLNRGDARMIDYTTPIYRRPREWIVRRKEDGLSWEKLKYGNRDSENELEIFIEEQTRNEGWQISKDEWFAIYDLEKQEYLDRMQNEVNSRTSIITSDDEKSDISIPEHPKSSWSLYKKRLLEVNKFSKESVDEIEKTTVKMLEQLSTDTRERGPIKGLVVGNVQSGKTANMAALMSLGADHGWNVFIILSGIVDNLRVQTQERLLDDLSNPGLITWRGLSNLAKRNDVDQTSRLNFSDGSKTAYFNVCLKNYRRLEDLIDWFHATQSSTRNMKVMIIDDESDQASVNTADVVNSDEKKRINDLITNLVNNKDKYGKDVKSKFKAMNYIGYTATPFANVLNEIGEDTLFPKHFITSLGQSKEYFGPQQIFGLSGEKEPMNIVRVVPVQEQSLLQDIHEEKRREMPKCLEESILWFLCSSAALRSINWKKPISMLVHTSVQTTHHQIIYSLIESYFNKNHSSILRAAEVLWENEKHRFTKKDFENVYPDYGFGKLEVSNVPSFNDIKLELLNILEENTRFIELDDEQELVYGNGVHICIDNSKASSISNSENEHVRLAYPQDNDKLEKAPLFLIIGGFTLSRGLTIQGLISTYFMRATALGDTLMQMGRWFGYRRGYELLPRIWMTDLTQQRFQFLSELDQQLRDSIEIMQIKDQKPIDVGVRIKNSPALSFMRITASNKMQMATNVELDYSGMRSQTVVFDRNEEILKSNLALAEKFLGKLSNPIISENNPSNISNIIFENVSFSCIKEEFLKDYQISKNSRVFSDMDKMMEWIELITEEGKLRNWNVIVAGRGKAVLDSSITSNTHWNFKHGSIEKVRRTERNHINDNNRIVFGVISAPTDIISDINIEKFQSDGNRSLDNIISKPHWNDRRFFGLDKTPQLIIYCIDRIQNDDEVGLDKAKETSTDVLGIMINIPGGESDPNANFAKSLVVDLSSREMHEVFKQED